MIKKTLLCCALLASLPLVACSEQNTIIDTHENKDDAVETITVRAASHYFDGNENADCIRFSYSVQPANARLQGVNLNITFADNRQNGSNYLRAVLDNVNAGYINVYCYQAFDSLATLRISATYNPSVYADVTIHYNQKFTEGFVGDWNPYTSGTNGLDFFGFLQGTWSSTGSITTETSVDRSDLFNYTDSTLKSHFGYQYNIDAIEGMYDTSNLSCNSSLDQISDYRDDFDYPRFIDFDFSTDYSNNSLLYNVHKDLNCAIGHRLYKWFEQLDDWSEIISESIDDILADYDESHLYDPDSQMVGSLHGSFEDYYDCLVNYIDDNFNKTTVNGKDLYTITLRLDNLKDDNKGTFGTIGIYNDVYTYITTGQSVQRINGKEEIITINPSATITDSEVYIPPKSCYTYNNLSAENTDIYF